MCFGKYFQELECSTAHISGTRNTRAWTIIFGSTASVVTEVEVGADVQFASIFTHFQKLCAFSLQMRILNGVIRYID